MAYKNNIPTASDFQDESQQDLLDNFAQLDVSFGIDHYEYSDTSGATGKHKQCTYTELAAAPTTLANEGSVYTKEGTNPAETNLFFRGENSGGGGGFEYQLTHVVAAETANFGVNTSAYQPNTNGGWTYLPGGLIMFYGTFTGTATTGTVTYPFAFPSGSAAFCIQVSVQAASSESHSITSSADTGFNYRRGGAATTLHWLAIGK